MDTAVLNISDERDQQLLQLLKLNDVGAFDELYHKYFGRVYNLVNIALSNDKSETEAVVAAVFLHLWEKRDEHQIDSLNKYIFAFTCMEILQKRRSAKSTGFSQLPARIGKRLNKFFTGHKPSFTVRFPGLS
jgi:DNA-directed RNA polymerase specialized sigma24 family protein